MTPNTELLGEIRERLVRIETKFDTHQEAQTAVRKDVDDHDKRIGALETNQKIMTVIGSILIFLVTIFNAQIVGFFT